MRIGSRKFRRLQRQFAALGLIGLVQFIFPQHVEAAVIRPVPVVARALEALPSAAVEATMPRVTLPEPAPLPAKRVVRVLATAYTSSDDETDRDPWTTASGARAGDGVVAANGLPFGTKVRFPDDYGDQVFTVLDRMHARYGRSRVDIWMPTKSEAKQWGVRSVRMEVL